MLLVSKRFFLTLRSHVVGPAGTRGWGVPDKAWLAACQPPELIHSPEEAIDAGSEIHEEIIHFIDYLPTHDINLAIQLNQLYLEEPGNVQQRVKKLTSVVRMPLIDQRSAESQEINGRYYDQVIEPADMVGYMILNDRVKDFSRGLRYLDILESARQGGAPNHHESEYSVQLGRDIPITLMLAESAKILGKKIGMRDSEFAVALEEVGILFPDICDEVEKFTDPERFASLVLHRSLVVRRFMACRSFLPAGTTLVEAAFDMLGAPNVTLENSDSHFAEYLAWLGAFQKKGLSWSNMLRAVDMLIQCRDDVQIRGDSVSKKVQDMLDAVPVAFLGTLEASVMNGSPTKTMLSLFSNSDDVISSGKSYGATEKGDVLQALVNSAELLTKDSRSLIKIEKNLAELDKIFDFERGLANLRVPNVVQYRPEWVVDLDKHKDGLELAVAALRMAFTNKEGSIYVMHFDVVNLLWGVEKSVELCLALSGKFSREAIFDIFKKIGEWVRTLLSPEFIPVSLFSLLARFEVKEVMEFMLKDDESRAKIREELFLIYGRHARKMLEELAGFPELFTDDNLREIAVDVSGLRKIYREEDLHARYVRWPSETLRPAVLAARIARDEHGVEMKACIEVLTRLDAVRLLELDRLDLAPVVLESYVPCLARFIKACAENPLGWDNFMFLVEGFRKNKLYKINPQEFRRMWQCAFDSILMAPEAFLDKEMFVRVVSTMQAEKWNFAEMEVHEVLRREPLLVYHMIQLRYNQELEAVSKGDKTIEGGDAAGDAEWMEAAEEKLAVS
ncbi:hypothetical protein BSKO_13341 [Bryopsis sp. KO-2023]|nr:hypothetical protein BSKO_13341 [Bryopsis sp. KO-2023]